ncbi:DUF4190 domain-containing protein [Cryptosporangium phraense]|uniref:DUF4190 domain-containing protein n=1 Tax=Cryptosporangium phraense TaxID=2593070 RepID=A0A545AZ96_9ACTN|nr:DUF4190 domain-containing protein [Cryptosporangium phraense]TQS46650.1 DUF4190 domain-containing protein [Cryptosporangium phraense]
MTYSPPPDESNPWAKPTSGFPDPTSGYPAPTSGYPNPTSGYPNPTSGYGATPAAYDPNAAYQQQPGAWGAPAPAYPAYGYPPPRKQNGKALAAMIVSIVSFMMCLGLPGIVGALLGHSAKKEIRQTGEDGEGFATAGIVVGWIGFGLSITFILVYAVIIVIAITTSSTSP